MRCVVRTSGFTLNRTGENRLGGGDTGGGSVPSSMSGNELGISHGLLSSPVHCSWGENKGASISEPLLVRKLKQIFIVNLCSLCMYDLTRP